MVSSPTVRATPEQTVSFTCRSHGFSPRNISPKWFKNGNELSASQTSVDPEGDSISYSISSTTKVLLPRGMFTPRSSARWPISPCRGALLSMGLPTCLRLSKVDAPHVSSSAHLPPRPQLAPPTCFFAPGLELPGIYFLTFLPNTRLLVELFTHYYAHLCQTRC